MPRLVIDDTIFEISLEQCSRCTTLADMLCDDEDAANATIPIPSSNCTIRSIDALLEFMGRKPTARRGSKRRKTDVYQESVARSLEMVRSANYLGYGEYLDYWTVWMSDAADNLNSNEFRTMLGISRALTGREIRELQQAYPWVI